MIIAFRVPEALRDDLDRDAVSQRCVRVPQIVKQERGRHVAAQRLAGREDCLKAVDASHGVKLRNAVAVLRFLAGGAVSSPQAVRLAGSWRATWPC